MPMPGRSSIYMRRLRYLDIASGAHLVSSSSGTKKDKSSCLGPVQTAHRHRFWPIKSNPRGSNGRSNARKGCLCFTLRPQGDWLWLLDSALLAAYQWRHRLYTAQANPDVPNGAQFCASQKRAPGHVGVMDLVLESLQLRPDDGAGGAGAYRRRRPAHPRHPPPLRPCRPAPARRARRGRRQARLLRPTQRRLPPAVRQKHLAPRRSRRQRGLGHRRRRGRPAQRRLVMLPPAARPLDPPAAEAGAHAADRFEQRWYARPCPP